MGFKQRTIVITGASGFIGSAVLRQSIQDGNNNIVLVRNNTNLNRIHELIKNCYVINQSRLTEEQLIDKIGENQPDEWIHLAWQGVVGKDRNESFQILENIPAIINAEFIAHKTGCTHWIGVGSQAEYGNPNCKIDESFPAAPTTVYGKSKLAANWATKALADSLGLNWSWIRIFSIYGPEDDPNRLISYLVRMFQQSMSPELTACEQFWDYLYIKDAAKAILKIAESDGCGVVNLGSGKAVPLRNIVDKVAFLCGNKSKPRYAKIPYRPDQVMHLEADIKKICRITHWSPTVDLDHGLQEVVSGYHKK